MRCGRGIEGVRDIAVRLPAARSGTAGLDLEQVVTAGEPGGGPSEHRVRAPVLGRGPGPARGHHGDGVLGRTAAGGARGPGDRGPDRLWGGRARGECDAGARGARETEGVRDIAVRLPAARSGTAGLDLEQVVTAGEPGGGPSEHRVRAPVLGRGPGPARG